MAALSPLKTPEAMSTAPEVADPRRARLNLLGRFALIGLQGETLEVAPRRGKALLAYLAIERSTHQTRDHFSALIWGESTQQRARQSLRQLLTTLRRDLPAELRGVLRVEGDTIELDRSLTSVDAIEMESLAAEGTISSCERAAALYQGNFLAGVEVGAPAFGQWLLNQRERYAALAIECLSTVLDKLMDSEQRDRASATALRILSLDQLHEGAHRALIQIYASQGQRALAMRQYQRCSELLQRELGVQPERKTVDLFLDISRSQAGLPSLAGPAATPIDLPLHNMEFAPTDLRLQEPSKRRDCGVKKQDADRPPLFGRAAELDTIGRCASRCARTGNGEIVLLLGEAGIGKTALIEAATAALRESATIIAAQGHATEQGREMQIWIDLLRHAIPNVGTYLASSQKQAEEAVFAALRHLQSGDPQGLPLLIVVEHLQWVDPPALEALVYLANRLSSLPALLIVSSRIEDVAPESDLRNIVNWLSSLSHATTVRLGPLDRGSLRSVMELAAKEGGTTALEEAALESIQRLSEGNPSVAGEMTQAQASGAPRGGDRDALPEKVVAGILQRLDSLKPEAISALDAAAVVGPECEIELWQRVAQLDTSKTLDLFDYLVRHGWLEPKSGRFRFARERFRVAVYGHIATHKRARLHELAFTAIEELYSADLRPYHVDLARHALASDRAGAAAGHLVSAAEVEARAGNWNAVADLASRAKNLVLAEDAATRTVTQGSADLLLARAMRIHPATRQAASAMLRRLRGHSQRVTDKKLAANLVMSISMFLDSEGARTDALVEARRGLRLLEEAGAELPWTAGDRLYSQTQWLAGHREGGLQRLQSTFEHYRAIGDRQGEALALGTLALCHGIAGEFIEGLAAVTAGIEIAGKHSDPLVIVLCQQFQGQLLVWQGKSDSAIDLLAKALHTAEEIGDLPRQYLLLGHLGHARLGLGESHAAIETLDNALDLASRLGTAFQIPFFTAVRAEALSVSERASEANDAARQALQLAVERNQPWSQSIASRAMATAALCHDSADLRIPIRTLQSALAIQESLGLKFEIARTLQLQSVALLRLGQTEGSERSEKRSQHLFDRMGIPRPALPHGLQPGATGP
ncbi:MAG: BTAD domain-containing putative transcriptional regulator [Kiloniellales bacterium]